MLGLGQEVGENSLVDLSLTVDTTLKEGLACRVESTVKDGKESKSVLGEDLTGLVGDRAEDGNVLELGFDETHDDGGEVIVIDRSIGSSK